MTNYVYDEANITEEVDAAGLVQARYAQGPGIDEPVAMLRDGTTNFFAADGLGSVTSLTDGSGTIGASYTYESFGGLLSTTGTLQNPVRYTGREYDAETGMYYYRARYYEPSIGRFTSGDPKRFVADENFYRYVSNSPTTYIDPLGWAACKSGLCPDCPRGRWVSGAVTAEAYANVKIASGGGLLFAGVMICTSNPTFNVPFTTLCGFGNLALSPRPPLTRPQRPWGGGLGLGGAFFSCTGSPCREDLAGAEGGWFAQIGPAYYFRERSAGGGRCQGAGVGFDFGLGAGGFKCNTWIGDSIGGIR